MSEEKKHCWFPPSSASRGILCPASVKLNQNSDNSSSYADRGTECHDAIEQFDVLGRMPEVDFIEDWQEQAVFDARFQRDQLLKQMKVGQLSTYLEEQVTLADYGRGDIYGTVDMIAHDPENNRLFIIDYKFGAGVAVTPTENPQLMIYALGALDRFKDVYDVCLVIVQPRRFDEALVWETNPGYLKDWYRSVLLPTIQEAEGENPRFSPGEDQCRWCIAAKKGCPAQVQQLKDMLPVVQNDQAEVTNDVIADLLNRIPGVQSAIKQVQEIAFDRMMNGEKLPGFKLVRKSKNRTWVDVEKADVFLQRRKLKMDERYKLTLLSPAQAERALGARGLLTPRMVTALEKHITKPEGEPTWAKEDDKRQEYIPVNPMDLLPEDVDVDDLF